MSDTPRFTFHLSLHDNYGGDDLHMAMGLDYDTIRISPRAVDEMKAGLFVGMDQVVSLMKRRKFRKDLFIRAAQQLAAQMAERMEDAEGWHDQDRIEPARQQLGGRWR